MTAAIQLLGQRTRPFLGPRSGPALVWVLSAAIGVGTAKLLFPFDMIAGSSAYWGNPQGVIHSSWGDMGQSLSGYDVFVRDAWRWPLFRVAGLGPPWTNVVFTDSTPLVALAGRLLFRATGVVVPLYGGWSAACVVGMALASTLFVRSLGARGLAAGGGAAVIGVSMPAFLARFGHLSLSAQWLIPLALAYYATTRRAYTPRLLWWGPALCLLALWIHPYLLFMTGLIVATALGQAALESRLRLRDAAAVIAGTGALVGFSMFAMGYLSDADSVRTGGFGYFSANVLSPFIPQVSGLPIGTAYLIDGTGGQYEGFCYLGLGLLGLLTVVFIQPYAIRLRRDGLLLAVLVGSAAMAISPKVMAGLTTLVIVPLPAFIMEAGAVLRASGRFAWVPVYALAGIAVALAARHRAGVPIVLLAALLQWVDAGAWRGHIQSTVAAPAPALLDRAAWLAALGQVDQVLLDPPLLCIADTPDGAWQSRLAVEVQLRASEARVVTNTVYATRQRADCVPGPPARRAIVIRLSPGATPDQGPNCQANAFMSVCSDTLGADRLRPLLLVPPASGLPRPTHP